MINAEIEEEEENKYPTLVISNTGVIVLAQCGVGGGLFAGMIVGPEESQTIGYYSQAWHADLFKPFHGKLTLSNGGG
ncbi:MAG: hypothetical protein GWN14_17465 [candidate division Zixibacteria bacterium]|nr:hypothetical protein [candidate division Zixibacteria bacterium]